MRKIFVIFACLITTLLLGQDDGRAFDMQMTADGQLVVMAQSVYKGVIVKEADYAIVGRLTTDEGNPVKTFADVLRSRQPLTVSIGDQGSAARNKEVCERTMDLLKRYDAFDRVKIRTRLPLMNQLMDRHAKAVRTFKAFSMSRCEGDDYTDADGRFATHRMPTDYPYIEDTARPFNVIIGHAAVALYNDRNYWGGTVDFGSFDMAQPEAGKPLKVDIVCADSINTFELLPEQPSTTIERSAPNALTLSLGKVGEPVTLIVNGDHQTGHVLHLFPRAWREDRSSADISFEPGYHKLSEPLRVSSNQSVYIAPGAVVDGTIRIDEAQHARIYGGGMVVNSAGPVVTVSWSKHCNVEDIVVHGHRPQAWQTIVSNSDNILLRQLRIISTRYASTDGLDIVSSHDIKADSCFIRASDDAIAIKGMSELKPSEAPPVRDIALSHMQLWNDCNNAISIGAETRAVFSNISLTDTDILYSYDDPEFHLQLDERAALGLCCLHGTYFTNLVYDDIRVYHCQRLIAMGFKPSFWFGTILGDQSTPGGIKHVVFRNIKSMGRADSPIANDVWLYGWYNSGTPTKLIEHITFDNVTVDGSLLKNADHPSLKTNNTPRTNIVRPLWFK